MKTVLRKAMTLLLCLCLLLSSVPAAFAEIRNDPAAPEEAAGDMYFSEQPEVSGVSAENDTSDEGNTDDESAPLLPNPNLKTGGAAFASGTWGILNWTLTSGTLKIMGSGPMNDFRSGEDFRAWREHLDSITTVIIDIGVTCIGDYAFCDCSNLTNVDYRFSVTSIGERAFYRCSSLKNVEILSSVTSIGEGAFIGCISMESVAIQKGVTSINGSAFSGCTSLESVTIPSSVTFMGEGAFSDCSSMESVTIWVGATCIGNEAFLRCTSLKNVTIPYSITRFGGYAFSGCTGLESVTIEGGTDIPYHAFYGCSNLENVTISNSVTVIQEGAFWKCTSLPSVTIPRSVTEIQVHAFEGCSNLNDVYYEGSEAEWGMISPNDLLDRPVTVHCGYAIYGSIVNTVDKPEDTPWTVELDRPFEECVRQLTSIEYNPLLAYYLAVLSRAVYREGDIQCSLISLRFDYKNAEKMFLDDPEHYCSGYVVAKKAFKENGKDKTLVLIVIRGSVGYNWNNLLDIGAPWAGTGQYPALRRDAETVHEALKRLFDGTIPNDPDTYYVITGHSQGAGAANILGTMLWDEQVPTSNIYDYTFASPNVACFESDSNWNPDERYNYIHNIVNSDDPVWCLPNKPILMLLGRIFGNENARWWKYGRIGCFLKEEISLVPQHDMIYYIRYLSHLNPASAFASGNYILLFYRVLIGRCPVDMTVYDQNGKPVAGVSDNQADYYDSEFGQVMIFVEGDQKYFFLPPDQDYDVKITATADGDMTYEILDYELVNGEITSKKTFSSVPLSSGKLMASTVSNNIPNSNSRLYVMDKYGAPLCEVQEDGTEVPITVDPTLGVPIDVGHFPDARFRAYIRANFDRDDPKNGYLSAEEIAQADYIDVIGEGITNLAGIKYFTSLKYLYCRDNQLTKLGVGDCSALEVLDCSGNGLTELDLSGCDKVDCLRCAGNSLTILDISNCPSLLDLFQNGVRRETDGVVSHWYDDGMYYIDHIPGLSYDAGVEIWTKAYPKPDCVTPAYLSRIEEEAYAGCVFRSVELNEALTYIGPRAFADCPNLTCIYIPAPTIRIDPEAFGTRTALTVFGPPNGDAEDFAQDHGLAFVAVPQAGLS